MEATVRQVPVTGFQISAALTALVLMKPDLSVPPPVASTVPSGKAVRLTKLRGKCRAPVGCHFGVGCDMSSVYAVLADAPERPSSLAEPAFMNLLGA